MCVLRLCTFPSRLMAEITRNRNGHTRNLTPRNTTRDPFVNSELGAPLLKLLNCKRNNNLKKPHPSTRGRKIASYQTLSPVRQTFVFLGSRCTQPLTPRNAHALRYEFSKWRTGQRGKLKKQSDFAMNSQHTPSLER